MHRHPPVCYARSRYPPPLLRYLLPQALVREQYSVVRLLVLLAARRLCARLLGRSLALHSADDIVDTKQHARHLLVVVSYCQQHARHLLVVICWLLLDIGGHCWLLLVICRQRTVRGDRNEEMRKQSEHTQE